jgi:diketogulonate reductase-like aldo/keto reductase
MRTVRLPDGAEVSAIGQGTWHMAERKRAAREEEAALRLGVDLGMTLIDTAEMYADGGAEEVVGAAIAGQRERVFVVSKVYPHNASRSGVPAACERSLRRLRTDYIDLYLLHWPGSVPVAETVLAFEALREAGKIRRWGVSNFDVGEMEEVAALAQGSACATDQVIYHPGARGMEFDLLPWCTKRRMPIMAYSPLGQGGQLLRSTALVQIARQRQATPAQIALAWAIRHGTVIAIPKSSDAEHVRENAAAAELVLSEAELKVIDEAFPPPSRKRPLSML